MGKITINYDFFEEILNAREKFNGFKILRAERKYFGCFLLPIYTIIDAIPPTQLERIPLTLTLQFLCLTELYYLSGIITHTDKYEESARENLMELLPKLRDINVATNYELLMDSYLDSKNYKIQKDDNNKKVLVQNKYIMVPTHNPIFNDEGQTQMTSIHQEHIVGTSDYVLSVGLNQKNKQKVLSPLLNPAKR